MTGQISAAAENWKLARPFAISRGVRTKAEIVVATINSDGLTAFGECFPYPRYNETSESVIALIQGLENGFECGQGARQRLQQAMPHGAARNAVDCALWSLESQQIGEPVWKLAGLPAAPKAIITAFTIGLDAPDQMAAAAEAACDYPLLKIKLGGGEDENRVRAVRGAAPNARLIVDANEAWSPDTLKPLTYALADLGVELIEQPLPANTDDTLRSFESPVPICADESCHDLASLEGCLGKYDAINIKLDKSGGLTEGLALLQAAREAGLGVMTGCTTATSLAMAPGLILGAQSDFVDLDGPLWLAEDRRPALKYETGQISGWVSGVFGV